MDDKDIIKYGQFNELELAIIDQLKKSDLMKKLLDSDGHQFLYELKKIASSISTNEPDKLTPSFIINTFNNAYKNACINRDDFIICDINEGAITDFLNQKYILAAHSVIENVVFAGFQKSSKCAFLFNIATVDSISNINITETITNMEFDKTNEIDFYIRGGIVGISNSLIEEIQLIITILKGLNYQIGIIDNNSLFGNCNPNNHIDGSSLMINTNISNITYYIPNFEMAKYKNLCINNNNDHIRYTNNKYLNALYHNDEFKIIRC